MDAGMGFLTDDRNESGCFLLLDVTANMQTAILRKVVADQYRQRKRGTV